MYFFLGSSAVPGGCLSLGFVCCGISDVRSCVLSQFDLEVIYFNRYFCYLFSCKPGAPATFVLFSSGLLCTPSSLNATSAFSRVDCFLGCGS